MGCQRLPPGVLADGSAACDSVRCGAPWGVGCWGGSREALPPLCRVGGVWRTRGGTRGATLSARAREPRKTLNRREGGGPQARPSRARPGGCSTGVPGGVPTAGAGGCWPSARSSAEVLGRASTSAPLGGAREASGGGAAPRGGAPRRPDGRTPTLEILPADVRPLPSSGPAAPGSRCPRWPRWRSPAPRGSPWLAAGPCRACRAVRRPGGPLAALLDGVELLAAEGLDGVPPPRGRCSTPGRLVRGPRRCPGPRGGGAARRCPPSPREDLDGRGCGAPRRGRGGGARQRRRPSTWWSSSTWPAPVKW